MSTTCQVILNRSLTLKTIKKVSTINAILLVLEKPVKTNGIKP